MNSYGKFALGGVGTTLFFVVVLGEVTDYTWASFAFCGVIALLAIAQELRR